jgi:hypothetical protein
LKNRRPPPIVEHRKHRRLLAAPASSPSPPPAPRASAALDRRIRAWRGDDPEANERGAFVRKSRTEQYREMIAAWVARHRLANVPDTWTRIGEREVARYVAEHSMSHLQIIEGPDHRIVIRPAAGLWDDLKRAILMQYGRAKKVITDPKGPKNMAWWHYIKDLRKKTGER